jgi:hypothetical protein
MSAWHELPRLSKPSAAVEEYVAEVDRLRAWVDHLGQWILGSGTERQIRAGEWPEGREP